MTNKDYTKMTDKELDEALANSRKSLSNDDEHIFNFLLTSDLDLLIEEKQRRLAKQIKNINGVDL